MPEEGPLKILFFIKVMRKLAKMLRMTIFRSLELTQTPATIQGAFFRGKLRDRSSLTQEIPAVWRDSGSYTATVWEDRACTENIGTNTKQGKWLAVEGGQNMNPFLMLPHLDPQSPSWIESPCCVPQRPLVSPLTVAFSSLWDHCSLTRPEASWWLEL